MTFKQFTTEKYLQSPYEKEESEFHQKIKQFLSKKDQGYVMGAFRDIQQSRSEDIFYEQTAWQISKQVNEEKEETNKVMLFLVENLTKWPFLPDPIPTLELPCGYRWDRVCGFKEYVVTKTGRYRFGYLTWLDYGGSEND